MNRHATPGALITPLEDVYTAPAPDTEVDEPLAAPPAPPAEPTIQVGEPGEMEALRAQVAQLQTMLLTAVEKGLLAAAEKPKPEGRPVEQVESELLKRIPIESADTEKARMLTILAAEARVPLFIAPSEDDKATARKYQPSTRPEDLQYPPRFFGINGVYFYIPVGRKTTVPASIWEMYMDSLEPKVRGNQPPIMMTAEMLDAISAGDPDALQGASAAR